MKAKTHIKSVIFNKDYANKKVGDVLKCSAVMALHLIQLGVAEIEISQEKVIEKKVIELKKPIKKHKK